MRRCIILHEIIFNYYEFVPMYDLCKVNKICVLSNTSWFMTPSHDFKIHDTIPQMIITKYIYLILYNFYKIYV